MDIDFVDHGDGTITLSSTISDGITFISPDETRLIGDNVSVSFDGVVSISSVVVSPPLVWDKVGDRFFEAGLDKGVLYLSDGTAVPWNGLVSIDEKNTKDSSSVYYEGVKINELVSFGDFSATMTAITYPDEFLEFEGISQFVNGVFVGSQKTKAFNLSYRTHIGNDVDNDISDYKIHILYNVMAVPNDTTYSTLTDTPALTMFEWDISAISEEVPGFAPTAHIIIDSSKIYPPLLADLELMLYGNDTVGPSLMSISELIYFINNFAAIEIIDNLDGTWTAIVDTAHESYLTYPATDLFQLDNVNAEYLDPSKYVISNTN